MRALLLLCLCGVLAFILVATYQHLARDDVACPAARALALQPPGTTIHGMLVMTTPSQQAQAMNPFDMRRVAAISISLDTPAVEGSAAATETGSHRAHAPGNTATPSTSSTHQGSSSAATAGSSAAGTGIGSSSRPPASNVGGAGGDGDDPRRNPPLPSSHQVPFPSLKVSLSKIRIMSDADKLAALGLSHSTGEMCVPQRSLAWHSHRVCRITASDVPSLTGVGYSTSSAVVDNKVKIHPLILAGQVPDTTAALSADVRRRMHMSVQLEPVAAQLYQQGLQQLFALYVVTLQQTGILVQRLSEDALVSVIPSAVAAHPPIEPLTEEVWSGLSQQQERSEQLVPNSVVAHNAAAPTACAAAGRTWQQFSQCLRQMPETQQHGFLLKFESLTLEAKAAAGDVALPITSKALDARASQWFQQHNQKVVRPLSAARKAITKSLKAKAKIGKAIVAKPG
ncbi:hypothetical protein COO60DRAFT_1466038 [Scenedesmus sp. NREL 46B-D3]|nr:hypothetical protein COO60DRAFT_1466038 [Scenedesmus sp. NREL 46B-D3]